MCRIWSTAGWSDDFIDPLIPRSERFLVGTRYLLPELVNSLPADQLADCMSMDEAMRFALTAGITGKSDQAGSRAKRA